MNDWFGLLRPAYSLRAHVPAHAARTLLKAMFTGQGRIVITPHAIDPDTGLQSVTIDTDGPLTHHQVRTLLRDRLGEDLVHLTDPALGTAATGKTTQRLCVPTADARDLALLDRDADHRVITHLMLNPDGLDTSSGRRRRVALLSNATDVLDLGPLPAPLVLPALESMAVHLRRATGLDIHPIPVDAATPEDFAAAARAIAPGFAAISLAHTHPAHAAAVRAALAGGPAPLADTATAHAIATSAATLSTLKRQDLDPGDAVIVLAGAHLLDGNLVGLLHANGVGELILADPPTPGAEPLVEAADLVIDLTGRLPRPSDGTPILHACLQEPPLLHATAHHPHPLHVLPALVTVATHGMQPGVGALLAATRTLAGLAEEGRLLPPVDRPGLTQALTAAMTADA
ncbi:malic enzyme-like protein [Kitasatospora sp. NPDC059571]|uniref:malic enzyme-like protein n=1 Tax=Kitasatospora sp. NPDC059571 TaxID=3346871 RepID=UPI0036A917E5